MMFKGIYRGYASDISSALELASRDAVFGRNTTTRLPVS
jgi:hypothetical protein